MLTLAKLGSTICHQNSIHLQAFKGASVGGAAVQQPGVKQGHDCLTMTLSAKSDMLLQTHERASAAHLVHTKLIDELNPEP